jgi:hypothetical protein
MREVKVRVRRSNTGQTWCVENIYYHGNAITRTQRQYHRNKEDALRVKEKREQKFRERGVLLEGEDE